MFDRARGTIALYDDKVLLATPPMLTSWRSMRDTGKAVSDTTVADYRQGYTFTSRPLAAHGKIVAGIRWAASRVISKKAAPTAPRGIAAHGFLTPRGGAREYSAVRVRRDATLLTAVHAWCGVSN